MENIQIILSVAGAALGLLITTITFIAKFVKAIKAKDKEEVARLYKEFADTVVQEVEVIKSKANDTIPSAAKLQMGLTKFNQYCIDNNITYNIDNAKAAIEKVVALTKVVNAREKDKAKGV